MTFDAVSVLNQVVSHALTLGWFDRANQHEPKHAPGHGLTAAVWADRIEPVPTDSGLTATTGRVVFNVRIYSNMLAEPQDAIDPNILAATNALLAAYSGDFTLGDQVRNVDLLGQAGAPLSAQAGYLTIGSTMYRVMTITLPLVISDMWSQAP